MFWQIAIQIQVAELRGAGLTLLGRMPEVRACLVHVQTMRADQIHPKKRTKKLHLGSFETLSRWEDGPTIK